VEKELHILILEDVATDAEMIERELQKGGIKFTSKRVETEGAFLSELKNFKPDLILADYKLPQFDGFSALAIVKEQCPDVPFILISGTLGEEQAVEALKAGATDYILKQKLTRLVPAVKRALREFEVRRERKIARENLKESGTLYRTIFETTGTAMTIDDEDTKISLANREFEKLSGYSREEIEGKKSWTEFIVKDDLDKVREYHRLRRIDPDSIPSTYETRIIDKQGNIKDVLVTASIIPGTKKSVGSLLDITELRKTEEALRESEKTYKNLVDNALVGTYKINLKGDILYVNDALAKILEFQSKEEMMVESVLTIYKNPKDRNILIENLKKKGWVESFETELLTKIKKVKNILLSATLDEDVISGMIIDITERKCAEEEIKKRVRELEDFYRMAVGREVKMIELKEEIEKLKKELIKYKK
jgi:PAS domain S-box-containing protein